MAVQELPGDVVPSHGIDAPSAWVVRWAALAPSGCAVLDVACGGGRHARYFAGRGHSVEAVDRDSTVIAALTGLTGVAARCVDLESAAWPYTGMKFGAIVVTNYLHRPLFPHLMESVARGGVLIYETFAAGNARFGRPSNPHFLLKPGELLQVVQPQLRVIAFEDVYEDQPRPAMMQRICAQRGL